MGDKLRRVVARYWSAGNAPASGRVSLVPCTVAVMDDETRRIVTQRVVAGDLDEDGMLSLEVLPSDDPDWRVSGPVAYEVNEHVSGAKRQYTILVPAGDDPLDLAYVRPVEDGGTTIHPVPMPGPPGPPNELSIGTVTDGSQAAASITGQSPAQILHLTLPAGPPNELSIGTVTTLPPDSVATATITGTPPAQTLDLGIPKGLTGNPQDTALGDLTNVTVPADTPTGRLLGTTAVGHWGAVPDPLVGHLAAANPHAQYVLLGQIGNLLTANQASGSDALGTTEGFAPAFCTIVSSTASALSGSRAVRATATDAGTYVYIGTATTGRVPVVAGRLYTFSVWARSDTPGQSLMPRILWVGSDNSTIATTNGTSQAVGTEWAVYSVTAVAPAGAALSRPFANLKQIVGQVVDLDQWGFWEGAGGDWAMPGTPILNLGRRVSRPNGTDRLVEVWGDGKWLVVAYDSGTRDVGGAKLRRVNAQVFKTGTPTLPTGFRDTWATGDNTFPTDDGIPTSLPGTLVTPAQ